MTKKDCDLSQGYSAYLPVAMDFFHSSPHHTYFLSRHTSTCFRHPILIYYPLNKKQPWFTPSLPECLAINAWLSCTLSWADLLVLTQLVLSFPLLLPGDQSSLLSPATPVTPPFRRTVLELFDEWVYFTPSVSCEPQTSPRGVNKFFLLHFCCFCAAIEFVYFSFLTPNLSG